MNDAFLRPRLIEFVVHAHRYDVVGDLFLNKAASVGLAPTVSDIEAGIETSPIPRATVGAREAVSAAFADAMVKTPNTSALAISPFGDA